MLQYCLLCSYLSCVQSLPQMHQDFLIPIPAKSICFLPIWTLQNPAVWSLVTRAHTLTYPLAIVHFLHMYCIRFLVWLTITFVFQSFVGIAHVVLPLSFTQFSNINQSLYYHKFECSNTLIANIIWGGATTVEYIGHSQWYFIGSRTVHKLGYDSLRIRLHFALLRL